MRLYFISEKNFVYLLKTLKKDYEVISPNRKSEYFWKVFDEEFVFNEYRAVNSIRQFFFPAKKTVGQYFNQLQKEKKPYCIVGAKACDLFSLNIQDYVFLSQPQDLDYRLNRENNLIISGDCIDFKEVCFCVLLDILPYPVKFFDLNISPIDNGYIVEVGSEKGDKIIVENEPLFKEAKENHILEINDRRKKMIERLFSHLKAQNLPKKDSLYSLIKNNYQANVWQKEALKCVECGACIMNCPTCHCFLLFDSKLEKDYLRAISWDGCQYKNFTKVAGGANPLKFRSYRLRNRYIKKFEFFYEKLNLYACTGCGRCIDSCIAKIDLREIFKELSYSEVNLK